MSIHHVAIPLTIDPLTISRALVAGIGGALGLMGREIWTRLREVEAAAQSLRDRRALHRRLETGSW